MAQPDYIFIVGPPRTGTSLLRKILDSSEEVAICGETHFFGGPGTLTMFMQSVFGEQIPFFNNKVRRGLQRTFRQVGDISTEGGAQKIVNYIYDDLNLPSWQRVCHQVSREEFLQCLLASDRTDRALFDLVISYQANGKPIRGEKTPEHVHQVPTLQGWFPQAKFIQMFRDPRAIYISQMKKKHKHPRWHQRLIANLSIIPEVLLSLNIIIMWRRIAQLHHKYQQLYGDNYLFCRYEDLVLEPEVQLKNISEFLEIDFSEAMLQQTYHNSSLVPRDKPITGFDPTAIDRWREHIHPLVNKWFIFWTKPYLLEFGYQP